MAEFAQAIWFALFYYLPSIGKVCLLKSATFHIRSRYTQLEHY